MLKRTYLLLVVCFLVAFSNLAHANNSPIGLWKTIDDSTGKPRSLIRISDKNGELIATVEKGLLPGETGDKVCYKCTDERKDKPLIGMVIMKGMKVKGDVYEGGRILDPENGQVYKCKIKLDNTDKQLEVRGFIGISLLGRSQIWIKEE